MVSCSFVRAFVRRAYNVVFAEIPDGGQTGMREDLSGVRRIEQYLDPAKNPMTWISQFLLSLGLYKCIVIMGVGFRFLRRLIIVGETCWLIPGGAMCYGGG